MEYKKIKSYQLSEVEMRELWRSEYCRQQIFTFDNVRVQFYDNMFDHCFYESANRQENDKSVLSLNRLEKMLWIKETLQDSDAILKKGWDKKNKTYYDDRRVAIVKGNYVVIICFTGLLKARFVTAYIKEDIENIMAAPDFEKTKRYFGDS